MPLNDINIQMTSFEWYMIVFLINNERQNKGQSLCFIFLKDDIWQKMTKQVTVASTTGMPIATSDTFSRDGPIVNDVNNLFSCICDASFRLISRQDEVDLANSDNVLSKDYYV